MTVVPTTFTSPTKNTFIDPHRASIVVSCPATTAGYGNPARISCPSFLKNKALTRVHPVHLYILDLIVKLPRGAIIVVPLYAGVNISGRRLVVTDNGFNLMCGSAIGGVGS